MQRLVCPHPWGLHLYVHELHAGYLTLCYTFVFQGNDDLQFVLENDSSELDKIMTKFCDELYAKVII